MNYLSRFLDRHPRLETALDYATAISIGLALAWLLVDHLSR